MHARVRTIGGAVLALVMAMAMAAGVRAQAPASAGEGPRFLVAVAGRPAPVEAEIGTTPLLRRRVSLTLENATLPEALRAMKRAVGIDFVYSPGVVNAA